MRTNIMINDSLLKRAFRFSNVKTKKELVNIALTEFVRNHSKKDIRELKGKIKFRRGYDYKKLRRSKS